MQVQGERAGDRRADRLLGEPDHGWVRDVQAGRALGGRGRLRGRPRDLVHVPSELDRELVLRVQRARVAGHGGRGDGQVEARQPVHIQHERAELSAPRAQHYLMREQERGITAR